MSAYYFKFWRKSFNIFLDFLLILPCSIFRLRTCIQFGAQTYTCLLISTEFSRTSSPILYVTLVLNPSAKTGCCKHAINHLESREHWHWACTSHVPSPELAGEWCFSPVIPGWQCGFREGGGAWNSPHSGAGGTVAGGRWDQQILLFGILSSMPGLCIYASKIAGIDASRRSAEAFLMERQRRLPAILGTCWMDTVLTA